MNKVPAFVSGRLKELVLSWAMKLGLVTHVALVGSLKCSMSGGINDVLASSKV
jgi:hypothetical protein